MLKNPCVIGVTIAADVDTDKLRVFRSFDFAKIKEKVEPVAYNVGRQTVPWKTVKLVLDAEAAAETGQERLGRLTNGR